jgi:hypothetical protein
MILVGQWRRRMAAARFLIASAVLVVSLSALQGCAAVGLTLLGVGAGTAAGTGTGHALDSITYKTFTVPVDGLVVATVMTLARMDISLTENQEVETGRKLIGQAGDQHRRDVGAPGRGGPWRRR